MSTTTNRMGKRQAEMVDLMYAAARDMAAHERRGDHDRADCVRRNMVDMTMYMRAGDYHMRRAIAAARKVA